jgi:hypothetical protein
VRALRLAVSLLFSFGAATALAQSRWFDQDISTPDDVVKLDSFERNRAASWACATARAAATDPVVSQEATNAWALYAPVLVAHADWILQLQKDLRSVSGFQNSPSMQHKTKKSMDLANDLLGKLLAFYKAIPRELSNGMDACQTIPIPDLTCGDKTFGCSGQVFPNFNMVVARIYGSATDDQRNAMRAAIANLKWEKASSKPTSTGKQ